MKHQILFALLTLVSSLGQAQLYFPPVSGEDWQTTSAEELNWCKDEIPELYQFLDQQNTKAFILLKDGKIVLEKYFGSFQKDSVWYWASAGKTLTAFMVGLAQEDGYLDIDDPSSDYLGKGWTVCPPEKEDLITIRHQLSMTTGLDYEVKNVDCTLDSCLKYRADAGTQWFYHNAPYTLLDQVIEGASGQNLNVYQRTKLRNITGINGAFLPLGFNNVFFSTPRAMARFGLLMLNRGNWNGTQILNDTAYFREMTTPSQSLNPSYGYLWWLNGQDHFMMPGLSLRLPGPMFKEAPSDMVSALGKNGQIINVVPSQNIVCVRMGNAPGEGAITPLLSDSIWHYLNQIMCSTASVDARTKEGDLNLYPNPARERFSVNNPWQEDAQFYFRDIRGRLVQSGSIGVGLQEVEISGTNSGIYVFELRSGNQSVFKKVVVR